MTTTAIRTSNRIRRSPRRYDEEDWTPGSNNGFTAGRETDSWVSGELRDVDLERERRLARLEKARAYNKDSPTLQTIYFGQEIAEARLAAEWAKLAKAEEEVRGRFAKIAAREAELKTLQESIERRSHSITIQQAELDAQFIVPDGDAEEEEEEDEEEEAVSSDEEEEDDDATEDESEAEDEGKDDWSDDKLPEGYYLEPASSPEHDWLGLGLVSVAVIGGHTHPELSGQPAFLAFIAAAAVLCMMLQPGIGRAFAKALKVSVVALVLATVLICGAALVSTMPALHNSKL